MKERNPLIDVLKGFTIILVVIGHACQWFSGDDRSQPLYTTIYAFHMPLFMFLSGYVSFNKRGEMNLLKRFQVLVIPFFVWFLISAAYHKYLFDIEKVGHYLKILIHDPTQGMWFLWLLFWECVLLYIALKVSKGREVWAMIGLWSIIIFIHRITGAQAPYYGLPELCWYFLYFGLGYLTHKYEPQSMRIIKPIGWTSVGLFPLLLLLPIPASSFLLYSVRLYTLALTGIAATYVVWQQIINLRNPLSARTTQCLQYLGGISLEIYVTHYYFHFLVPYIKTYIGDIFYLNIAIFVIIAILCCDGVQRLVRYVGWLRRILYGRF